MKKTGLLLLLVGLLFSCNPKIDFETIIPERVDKFAAGFIYDIKQGDIDKGLSKVIPEMHNQTGRDYLTNSFKSLESLQIDSFRIVNAKVQTLMGENGFTNYSIDYEYFVKGKHLYFTFGIRDQNETLLITAFDGRFSETSLTEIHSFTFDNKGAVHYLFLVLAILIPIFILVTLVFAVRTRLNRKWLWIIGILFGFVKFSLNWTTGQVGFQILSLQILGAGLTNAGLVTPWIITFSLPLVAIYYWIKKHLVERDKKILIEFAEEVKNRETGETA